MDNYEFYRPEVCDGDYCPRDCDVCPKREIILEMEEEDAEL